MSLRRLQDDGSTRTLTPETPTDVLTLAVKFAPGVEYERRRFNVWVYTDNFAYFPLKDGRPVAGVTTRAEPSMAPGDQDTADVVFVDVPLASLPRSSAHQDTTFVLALEAPGRPRLLFTNAFYLYDVADVVNDTAASVARRSAWEAYRSLPAPPETETPRLPYDLGDTTPTRTYPCYSPRRCYCSPPSVSSAERLWPSLAPTPSPARSSFATAAPGVEDSPTTTLVRSFLQGSPSARATVSEWAADDLNFLLPTPKRRRLWTATPSVRAPELEALLAGHFDSHHTL